MVVVTTQVKRRRGTTAENDAFTGAEGEIVVDTERHELRVHDGVTRGGFVIGASATNFVTKTTAQTISGLKTFSADIVLSRTTSIKNTTSGVSYTMLYRDTSGIHVGTSTQALLLAGSNARPKFNNNDIAMLSDIPTVGNGTITITQGGITKGTFTTNQGSNATIALDAGGGGGGGAVDSVNGKTGVVVLTATDVGALPDSTVIPTVNNPTITIKQGGVTKGSFTLNQATGGTIALDAGGGGGSGALVIGQILEVVGTADYTPEGCLLADGAEYTKAQFPDLWANFLTGTPKLQTCTYTEYANQIAEYGFCNKFAVDTTNETFKVPTRNKYRKLVKKIVNSDSWANIYDDGWVEQGGIHVLIANNSNYSQSLPIAMADTNYTVTIAQCASRDAEYEAFYYNQGCVLARTTTTVTLSNRRIASSGTRNIDIMWQVSGYTTIPDSTSNITREFVVVANGTLNQEQMDWSAWASSLAGKANIDLSNTPANVDYVVESQEPTAENNYTWYRKYRSGWVEQGGSYRISPADRDVSATITFPVVLSSINYVATCCPTSFQYSNNNTGYIFTQQKTISSCIFHVYTHNSGSVCGGFDWQVSGMAA